MFQEGFVAVVLLFLGLVPSVRAHDGEDLDDYKWRATASWWFSHPTGSFRAASDQVSFDLNKDLPFGNYSTFTGSIDWRFKRKHHLVFAVSPVYGTRTATLRRDITPYPPLSLDTSSPPLYYEAFA
jgi:hypothetical protein